MIAAALIGPRGDEPADVGQDKFDIFKGAIADSDADTLIVSAEAFYNRLLYADQGLAADLSTDQLDRQIAAIKTKLTALGVTSLTAAFVMRNEADRTVSRVVQGFHALQIDPTQNVLPPEHFDLSKPHDVLFGALESHGFEVAAVLFADPDDSRTLVERLWEKVGIADRIAGLPMTMGRHNVSFGTLGCLASGAISTVINRHHPEDGDINWRAKGRSKGSLRTAYKEIVKADVPFNGLGAAHTEKVQTAQALVTAQLGKWLSTHEMAVLAQTKWAGEPMSPMIPNALDQNGRTQVAQILRRYVEIMKENAKTVEIIGTDALKDVQLQASTLEREDA
jgi:hypothetical protein